MDTLSMNEKISPNNCIIYESGSRYLRTVCDTFGRRRETNQSINNNLSSLLGRALLFSYLCIFFSRESVCSVHDDIIVIYRYFFLAHDSIGYHRLSLFNVYKTQPINSLVLFMPNVIAGCQLCIFFSSLSLWFSCGLLTSCKIFPNDERRKKVLDLWDCACTCGALLFSADVIYLSFRWYDVFVCVMYRFVLKIMILSSI